MSEKNKRIAVCTRKERRRLRMTKRSVLVKNWCRPFFLLIEAEKQEDPKKFSMNFYKIYSFLKNILISGKLHDRMSLVLRVV